MAPGLRTPRVPAAGLRPAGIAGLVPGWRPLLRTRLRTGLRTRLRTGLGTGLRARSGLLRTRSVTGRAPRFARSPVVVLGRPVLVRHSSSVRSAGADFLESDPLVRRAVPDPPARCLARVELDGLPECRRRHVGGEHELRTGTH